MSVKVYDTITPASTTFPAVMAEHVNLVREDGTADSIQNLFNSKELGGGSDNSVTLTQKEFELLSDEEKFNGLYYTYDTKRIYKNGIQYGANEPLELTMDEFKALKEAGALDEKQEYIITTNENGTLLEASDIGYNGATSGLSSLSVQGTIDEVNDKIDNIIDDENVNENTVLSSKKTMEEIAFRTANRQVKTFDNSGSSAEKWYKICSAITGGIGCNIKLTASRADSTATVQYFSALFRDSRYRYTSSYISRERTVYESELVAEYSAYIIADANNDIWAHIPSYGKAIIEIDTRAITIDGTAGTPVEDYVYSSFEHQYDGRIDDTSKNTTSTWSSGMIASQINNATAIKYNNVINPNATKETSWNLAQGESHFYGRLLQLDGHLGSKSSTFSFLLFVKANYDNPTTVYVTQLAGMDDDRSNIAHTTYFELGVSSSGNLTITNKSAVTASYRFI